MKTEIELATDEQYKDALKRKKKLSKKTVKLAKKIAKLDRRIDKANVKHGKIVTTIVDIDEQLAVYDEQHKDRFEVATAPAKQPRRRA